MSAPSIPFLDLVTPHRELEQELTTVFREALRSAAFIGGPRVENFENEFAAFCQTEHAIAVSSGTDALRFALIAAGVKAGDVVITVPNTFIATTEAISQAGALPEFVDIDERTYNMSPENLRQYLETQCTVSDKAQLVSKRSGRPVTAIVPVHLYGQMADMDPILELAERYGLLVVEDACQAHGAEYFSRKHERWCKAGSMGRAAAFSFYPGKNLGACGEGGAITTNDPGIAKVTKMLRDHGQAKKYHHDVEGYNGRLDAIQTGILSVKLKHLPEWNAKRRERAAEYKRLFDAAGEGIAGSIRTLLVARRLPPVCRARGESRRPDVISEDRRDWYRHSLSDSTPSAACVSIPGLRGREIFQQRKKLLRRLSPCRCFRNWRVSNKQGLLRKLLKFIRGRVTKTEELVGAERSR